MGVTAWCGRLLSTVPGHTSSMPWDIGEDVLVIRLHDLCDGTQVGQPHDT